MAQRPDARNFLGRDVERRFARAAAYIAIASYDHADQDIVVVRTEYLGERKTWGPGLIVAVAKAWIGSTTEVLILEPWAGMDPPVALPLSRVMSIEKATDEQIRAVAYDDTE